MQDKADMTEEVRGRLGLEYTESVRNLRLGKLTCYSQVIRTKPSNISSRS